MISFVFSSFPVHDSNKSPFRCEFQVPPWDRGSDGGEFDRTSYVVSFNKSAGDKRVELIKIRFVTQWRKSER